MKKEKKEENIPTPEQLASKVHSYFSKEINDQIADMSKKEMDALLKDLAGTRYWIAILKYTELRSPLLDATLRGTSPTKEPDKISWAQGAMAGICDLETYVIDLNNPQPPQENQSDEEATDNGKPEGVIVS